MCLYVSPVTSDHSNVHNVYTVMCILVCRVRVSVCVCVSCMLVWLALTCACVDGGGGASWLASVFCLPRYVWPEGVGAQRSCAAWP